MRGKYSLHDATYVNPPSCGLTLAECAIKLMAAAGYRWRVAYDKTRGNAHDNEGKLIGRYWCLRVSSQGMPEQTLARCASRTYTHATRLLLEKAARFQYGSTSAKHLTIAEPRGC